MLLKIIGIQGRQDEGSSSEEAFYNIEKNLDVFEFHRDKIPTPMKTTIHEINFDIKNTLNELRNIFNAENKWWC